MINLLIPIAGRAQRFIDAGFTAPKPLIMVDNQHMIDWAMESIDHSNCRLIFIVRQDHITSFSIDRILKEKFGEDVVIVTVSEITRGTLETCLVAKDHIDLDEPLIIYTPDVCFDPVFDPQDFIDMDIAGLLLTFKANNPAHSYARLDEAGNVVETVEKKVISDQAAVGVYCFKYGGAFVQAAEGMIAKNITTNGEFYVCPIYNYTGGTTRTRLVDKMHVLGTPGDVEFFSNRVIPAFGTKPVALCADHSGFEAKEIMKQVLTERNIRFIDFGTYVARDCDHHDFISQVIRHIHDGTCHFGMGFCRSGQGFNIAANKAKGIRSALIFDTFTAEHARRHNAANFFAMPAKYLNESVMNDIVDALQNNSFDGGRHMTRIQKIEQDTTLFND